METVNLAVVSDTHGHLSLTQQALRLVRPFHPQAVIHCGDIGSPAIVRLFTEWPTHFVFGNVDRDLDPLREAIAAAGLTCHERAGEYTSAGKRIAFLHGDDEPRLAELVASQRWDLICFGHTHQSLCRQEGSTLLLNPGAVYRARPHSVAIVELPALQTHFLNF